MSSFLVRLSSELERLGVTKVATTLGIARNTIYNWSQKGNVPLNYLIELNDMGLDLGFVITGKAGSLGGGGGNYILDDLEIALINNFRRCETDAKKTIIKTSSLLSVGESATPPSTSSIHANTINTSIGTNNGPLTIDNRGKK